MSFVLDLSKLIDHSVYFNVINDMAWYNLFKLIKNDFVIIDAGANIGYLTLNFARLCPNGFIYSFEPDSENFAQLSRNVGANKFTNIKIFRKALGRTADQMRLYKLYASNPGANRILSSPVHSCQNEIVEVTTLDSFAASEKPARIDLIKIDVEGFEMFALEGGINLISSSRPILFVELVDQNLQQQNCSADMLVSYIESLHYEIIDAKFMKPIDKRDLTRHTDIVCFPK